MPGLKESLSELLAEGLGVATFHRGSLVGFLAEYKIKNLFFKAGGINVPLFDEGASRENRQTIYQNL